MILVTIVIPAVQNAIFTTATEAILQKVVVNATRDTLDANGQTHNMSNNFLVTVYSVAWLGQGQPQFTTESYAVAPFDHSIVQISTQTSVTVPTTKYWAEVNCWSPASVVFNFTSNRTSLDDGKGCETKDVFQDDTSQKSQYSLHNPVDSTSLPLNLARDNTNATSMCPEFPNRFLSIWWVPSSNPDFGGGVQGLASFCDIAYHKEAGLIKLMLEQQRCIFQRIRTSRTSFVKRVQQHAFSAHPS